MATLRRGGLAEANLSFVSDGDASVAILPVGSPSDGRFFQYAELIARQAHTVALRDVQPFYQEKQKSPFFNLPWKDGALRLKFHVDINALAAAERGGGSASAAVSSEKYLSLISI